MKRSNTDTNFSGILKRFEKKHKKFINETQDFSIRNKHGTRTMHERLDLWRKVQN